MPYALIVQPEVDRKFSKLARRDRARMQAVDKKVRQILDDPRRFKPLRAPMQNLRRVHVGPFILVYGIDEERKAVVLLDYEHHDRVYGR